MVGTTVQDIVEGEMKWNDRVDYSYVCNKQYQRNSLSSLKRTVPGSLPVPVDAGCVGADVQSVSS
jgi:hypothetical protein